MSWGSTWALLITFSTNISGLGQNPKKGCVRQARLTEAHGEGSDDPLCFWDCKHECQQRCCNVLNCCTGVCSGQQKLSSAWVGIKPSSAPEALGTLPSHILIQLQAPCLCFKLAYSKFSKQQKKNPETKPPKH